MYILKKGTVVKHGTVSSLLPSILEKGIQPRAHAHKYRSQSEIGPIARRGVYVGGLLAYNAAYLSFADIAKQLEKEQVGNNKGAVPVVLEIELGEDCPIVGDEDFIMLKERDSKGELGPEYKEEFERRMVEDSLAVWEDYRTAAIVREGGIPAGWIKRVEFPEVKRVVTERMELEANLFALACYSHRNELKENATVDAILSCSGSIVLSGSASPRDVMYRLNSFSVYKDENKRTDYIVGFHSLVGVQLDRLGVPQIS
ncbi:hypothetical protein [Serpens gallinarum]|uniref:Uncharacterized protein n=1 Tax=Serpens gallinarum TaxID=2763075 RepID=A0ABR8TK96_9PSED|nr:hypothetical protein [Serpens gallinarum]MBD7976187.1 hypothetical protein [Serpens gallinarum]